MLKLNFMSFVFSLPKFLELFNIYLYCSSFINVAITKSPTIYDNHSPSFVCIIIIIYKVSIKFAQL